MTKTKKTARTGAAVAVRTGVRAGTAVGVARPGDLTKPALGRVDVRR